MVAKGGASETRAAARDIVRRRAGPAARRVGRVSRAAADVRRVAAVRMRRDVCAQIARHARGGRALRGPAARARRAAQTAREVCPCARAHRACVGRRCQRPVLRCGRSSNVIDFCLCQLLGNSESVGQVKRSETETQQPTPPQSPAPVPPPWVFAENAALKAENAELRRRLGSAVESACDVFAALPATACAVWFERGRIFLHKQKQPLCVSVRLSAAAEGFSGAKKRAACWVVANNALVLRLPTATVSVSDDGFLTAELPPACHASVLGDPSAVLEFVSWAPRSNAVAVGELIQAIETSDGVRAGKDLQERVKRALGAKTLESVNDGDSGGRTLLHAACGVGNSALVLWLAKKKRANVDVCDREGWPPLFCALHGGHFTTALLLLGECRATAGIRSTNGTSALHALCMAPHTIQQHSTGFETILKLLLASGISVDDARVSDGLTPLMVVCRRNGASPECVQTLLQHGADSSKQSISGDTAVHFAATNCSAKVIDVFSLFSANGSVRNSAGKTPLDIAQECGIPEVVEATKKLGASIDVLSEYELAWIFALLPPSDIARLRRTCKLFLRVGGFVLGQEEYWRAQSVGKDALMASQKIRMQFGQNMDEWLAPADPSDSPDKIVLKIVIDGDPKVGRTRFLLAASGKPFDPSENPDFEFKVLHKTLHGQSVKLIVWDHQTPRFRTMADTTYRRALSFIICYSVTDRESFENIERWTKEVERFAREPLVMVVATQIDVDPSLRKVTNEEGATLCERLGIPHIAVSSKTGTNVQLALKVAAELALRKHCEDNHLELATLQPAKPHDEARRDCITM